MNKLELQSTCFENIKALCSNYRKDPSSRKTVDYLKKRLSSLENQWQDFEDRHKQLMLELEDKNIAYFKDDVYGKTNEMFLSTKADITNKLATLCRQNVKFDLGGPSDNDDDSDNVQLLLNKQECNFKAIHRVMSKIDVVNSSEKWELEDHFMTLKSKWEPIDKLHWEIDFHLKGSNEHYYQMFADIEQKYDELKRKINAKIWATVHYQKSTPRIEIPEFSGSYSQWISFKDLFLEAIHKNPMINNAQKMQHLKAKLKGEAERLVQHLSISSDNYNSCWDILNQRYDNRRLQFTAFMNTMLNLPIIQTADSYNLKKMHDVITECLNGISNIGIETSSWDPIIVHIMSQKLDSNTLSDYMKELQDHRELQNLHDFLYFLETRFMAYETMKSAKKANSTALEKSSNWKTANRHSQMKKHNFNVHQNKTSNYHTLYGKCPFCNGNHVLRHCDKFLQMDFDKRNDTVSKLQVCKNCLFSHGNNECKSRKTCNECNDKHHTLLHKSSTHSNTSANRKNNIEQRSSSSSSQQPTSNHLFKDNTEVLLTTVQLRVKSIDGTYVTLRALLDQGSQVNLITENAAQILRLPRDGINAFVSGIGSVSRECRGKLKFTCQSIHSDYSFDTQALIMSKLTNRLPTRTFEKGAWTHLENLKLADPDFNVSRQIDLLLGADVYSEIILEGVLRGDSSSPVAQQTQIGWILCGRTRQTFDCYVTLFNIEELTKFWENEEIQNAEDIPEDDKCEQFYKETVRRSSDGKYIVKMPLLADYEEKLGKSRKIVVSQFLRLEKRLEHNEKLSSMYKQFMEEYADLGHMKPADPISTDIYFLPHHGVLRENSTTTKLRVVFNASQITTSGVSLNNVMHKGANLQKDIQALIIKWRTYKYAFTADIEKMYRCIWIAKEQQHLQRIVWRDSRDHYLRDYQLCTVTYGTKCAPWLAMRTLKQLAIDDGPKHPEAAKILIEECYVDDVISGHNNLTEAKRLQQSLIQLLRGGGMNLRKWTANDRAILEDLREDQISTQTMFDFKGEQSAKTLGLGWNPSSDTFHFNWPVENSKQLTKRTLLSAISRFYDPLGWLSPVTVKAKLLFQKLWMSKLSWDDKVPSNIESEWLNLKTDLPCLRKATIKRWIGDSQNNVELLGFCDASEKAYACVIYSKVFNEHGQPIVTLLAARTKLAPLTQKTTLPRLELCGAQLLADLMEKVKQTFHGNVAIRAWSDSQVVLAWIQGNSTRWEKYVANRVTKIKNVIPADQWRYVKSEENPADCASRGLSPSKLMSFSLWWNGPEFLTNQNLSEDNPCTYQTNFGYINYVQDEKPSNENNEHNIITSLLNKYSSLTQVNRVVAWIQRFFANVRNKTNSETAYLTTSELCAAHKTIIMHTQQLQFNSEYKQLINNETVSTKSAIYKLNPYLNEMGIICVGGRLKHSSLPGEMKNPVIIPHAGRFTQLLIEEAHSTTLHGGARLTLTYIRQRYWIVGGNRAVKNQLRKCVRCHRFNKTNDYQLMGDLPQQRITPCRPFTHTGVDFTGHVEVKHNKGRGVKTSKGYIAIFICMATKAVHIELVSDLSTETFLAAFQRLCARRGTPKHMYSDCGTNFIGAAKILRQEFEEFKQLLKPDLFNGLAKLEVEWHFNAPAWPTAGGLWEAAVKSMKHHLRRVLGNQKLTYEEFMTILTKIEACLNSRPLCPLTEDPEEFYNCLTPGHFLTGSPILSMPLSDYNDINNIDLRRRWQLTEHMFQQYWKNWSNDYLTTLQTRSKWNKPTKNVKEGDIVLVKENNLPPGKWALGRILETHPGSDGYVRVTTIKTQAGIIKRPITKLSPLPFNSEIEDVKVNDAKIKPQQNSKNEPRSKSRNPISTLLMTMLLLFTFVTGSFSTTDGTRQAPASSAQITSLERDRPLYYDTVGKMQLVHDEWILMMYYNLTNYWEGTRRTQTYFENIKKLCHKTNLQHCMSTMDQLTHEMELLHHYNSVLINPHKHLSNRRRKRGLIDGVGYVANSLFGILDQQFAEKYQNDIQSLKTNENYLLELIKNQTTIVELENQVLKRSEDNIQRQLNSIDSFINQTDINIASIETEMEILSATAYINSASLTTYLLISSLRKFQEMLFNTLTNVYQGHVDVHLITPIRLIERLNEISGNLPKSLSLPVENYKENIKDVYKLINVKARVTENYFLFEAHIPLVTNEDFDIYKAIPLSVSISNETTYVQLSNKYIAVNFKKNAYLSMSDNDLSYCIQQKSRNFLCKKNLPSYNLHSKGAPCEAKLLSHRNIGPCDVERASCKDTWIELQTQNSWLAICCERCSLRIICNKDVTSQTISSSSIVTLPQGCVLQSTDLTIYAQRQYKDHMEMDYEFTAPTVDTSINKIVNLTYVSAPNILPSKSMNPEIEAIEEKIATQKKNEVSLPTITSHDIHQYAISYFLLTAAIIVVLVVVGRNHCLRKCTNNAKNNKVSQPPEEIELQVIKKPDYQEGASVAQTTKDVRVEPGPGNRNIAFQFD